MDLVTVATRERWLMRSTLLPLAAIALVVGSTIVRSADWRVALIVTAEYLPLMWLCWRDGYGRPTADRPAASSFGVYMLAALVGVAAWAFLRWLLTPSAQSLAAGASVLSPPLMLTCFAWWARANLVWIGNERARLLNLPR